MGIVGLGQQNHLKNALGGTMSLKEILSPNFPVGNVNQKTQPTKAVEQYTNNGLFAGNNFATMFKINARPVSSAFRG